MLRSARRLGEAAGLACLLAVVALAAAGTVLVLCYLAGLRDRPAQLVGVLSGILSSSVLGAGLVTAVRRGEDELPPWVGLASGIGAVGGVLLVAGSLLAQLAIVVAAALGAGSAARLVAGYVVLLGVVAAGGVAVLRARRLDRRDADRIAAQLVYFLPGVDARSLARDVYDQKWHHVGRAIAVESRCAGVVRREGGGGGA